MSVIRVSHPTGIIDGKIKLEGSKSISNRVLIIQALCKKKFDIKRLSKSDDTQVLHKLLSANKLKEYDVHHAGTSFRFLTAYLAIQKGKQVLTGSSRMKQRPIGPLVEALRQLGCQIDYLGKKGYPPLKIGKPRKLDSAYEVTIDAGISSQYISALLLIAPTLPNGIKLNLTGDLVSESYLNMTLKTLAYFGIEYSKEGQTITIAPQDYQAKDFVVEADWSASSYYYAIVSMAKEGQVSLKGLFEESTQGDAAMVGIGRMLGVDSKWVDGRLVISKDVHSAISLEYDFINQPDLAQTIAVICAANGVQGKFIGLKTLRIKETDRIEALDTELAKLNSSFKQNGHKHDSELYEIGPKLNFEQGLQRFKTYKDHRMAMAFAPLALLAPIEISKPEVVSKSYPTYWEDLKSLGFKIQPVASE